MAIRARISGSDLAHLRQRLLALAGPQAEAEMVKANERNAKDFKDTVARIVPKGDPKDGNLANTLRQYSPGGVAAAVEIGGPGQPHPLHLEAGHRNRDGSFTPGKPFWNPAKRVTRKKARNRQLRAQRIAIKKITGG